MAITVSGKERAKKLNLEWQHYAVVESNTYIEFGHRTLWTTFGWLGAWRLSPAVLRFGDGVGASLAVVLSHIFTLLEGSSLVFKNMPDAEGIAVESALLAELGAVRAQWLIVHLREVYVFALKHHVTLVLENIS